MYSYVISLLYCSLTPIYMILIGFMTSLFVYLGDGPLWPYTDTTHIFYDACKDNWWTNLLYVNNIVYPARQVGYIFVPQCMYVL